MWLACKNVSSARGFLSIKWFSKGKMFVSCFNFDRNQSASKKKCVQKCLFFSLVKKRPPPPCKWQCTGAVRGGPPGKVIKIFNEGKDDILLSCKQIFSCLSAFWNIYLTKLQFSRRKLSQKMQFLAQTFPPDAQCRFLLEVKQMPQWVVSSEVLTTHKVWRYVQDRSC